jgi:hypothetical protein
LRARQQALTDAKIAWRLPTQMMMLVVRFLAARSLFLRLDLDRFYSVNDCCIVRSDSSAALREETERERTSPGRVNANLVRTDVNDFAVVSATAGGAHSRPSAPVIGPTES